MIKTIFVPGCMTIISEPLRARIRIHGAEGWLEVGHSSTDPWERTMGMSMKEYMRLRYVTPLTSDKARTFIAAIFKVNTWNIY